MSPEIFLQNLFTDNSPYILSEEEKKTIQFEGMKAFIFKKLNSSKYRASSMPESLAKSVSVKVEKSVDASKPIHVTVPFGGYKKWQLPSYPHPDWAEVFNIHFLKRYLSPIAAAYTPGVILNYVSDEVFIPKMNNYPQADVDTYNEEFKALLSAMEDGCQPNLKLKFSKIRDEISQDEILSRFDKTIERLRKDWYKLDPLVREGKLKKTERNYKGDLHSMSEKERAETLLNSTLMHDAFIEGEWESGVDWAFGELMIPVGFRYTGSWGIHIRSSRTSAVQFWIGVGALKSIDDTFQPTILTNEQYLAAKHNLTYLKLEPFMGFEYLSGISILNCN